ncbi:ribonuclease H-like domain-containing protein [Rhizophagus irregularis DAOM 181602=DAOM 197198]|nr:ribonuclease H-like domain-containing protein [Rhizophagus irregularis DAOM 181602=DAOM 197198]
MVSTRIEALTFKQELTNIRHQLKSLKNIEYYTDGSLANWTIDNNNLLYRADNTTVDLGTAFYTSNELGEFSVYSCLSLWPSSTRAEIVAIFLALLTAPENSNVTIYTDSLGAINSINSAFNSTTRTWLKKTNNLIIIKIIMLIREASINLKLIKIKGHSGIIGNDIADKLAKKGQYKPIEVNIRRFILKILATGEATEWSLLKNNQELCYGDVNQIDWKITWLISIIARGSILAIRKPKLYKEMKCIMKCNKKENWNHLFECQAYEVAWQKILEITTKESIIICLKQKQIRSQGKDFIKKVLQNILGITAKSEKFQKFQQLALEISLTEAQTLMANMLIRFILAFKELIWKPRCEQVILWEKREGISRTDKITSESKAKNNPNQLSEFKVKDNSNQLTNKAKDLKMGKVDQLQKTVSLVKKSMDTFVRKYICEDWILIKKKVDKITLYMSEKLLD